MKFYENSSQYEILRKIVPIWNFKKIRPQYEILRKFVPHMKF